MLWELGCSVGLGETREGRGSCLLSRSEPLPPICSFTFEPQGILLTKVHHLLVSVLEVGKLGRTLGVGGMTLLKELKAEQQSQAAPFL